MTNLAVIPVLIGPMQALMAVLPALLLALGGALLALFRPSTIKKLALLLWSQKLVVLPTTVAIVLLVHYWPALFPPTGNAAAREGAQDAWLLWRGSLGRRAVVPCDAGEPRRGQIQWRFDQSPMRSCYASPAVVGNRVYVTGSDFMPPLKDRGAIFAIDADSGELVWQFRAEGYRATFSSAAVVGDRLVVGEGLHETRDARIYCIDLAASEASGRGVKLWDLRTASHVESSPCIYEGKVYIGAGDDGFYCLDLEGDGNGDPKVIWHATGELYLDCEPSAAAYDGRVYFGLGQGGKAIVCLDAATGEPVWRVSTPHPAFGSPAIADGKIVVGMGIGNYVQSPEQIADGIRKQMLQAKATDEAIRQATKDLVPAGEVWCLDAATGEIVWKFTDVERTVLGSPAIADGRVYFTSRDRRLYCVGLTDGKLLDTFDAGAPIVSAPAVGDECVYVVTQNGHLCGVDRRTFRPVWSVNLNSSTVSSPVVARGHVYVGVDAGGLLCVGEPGGVEKTPLWAGPGGGGGQSGWVDGSAVPAKVTSAWRYIPGDDGVITSPAACVGDSLYVGVRAGEKTGVARLSMELDALMLQAPQEQWFVETVHPVGTCPVVVDDKVLFIDNPGWADDDRDRAGRSLRCVDADTGTVLWQSPLAANASELLVATGERVYVNDTGTALTCLDLQGNTLWTRPNTRIVGLPLSVGCLLYAIAWHADQFMLIALDGPTGELLWAQVIGTGPFPRSLIEGSWERMPDGSLVCDMIIGDPSGPTTGPVLAGGKLWVGGSEGMTAYDPVRGEKVLHVDTEDGLVSRLVCDEDHVLARVGLGPILVIDAATGMKVGETIEDMGFASPWLLAGDTIVYSDGEALRRSDLTAGASAQLAKLYPKYYGPIVGELLVTRSHILVATEKRGLVCLRPKAN